MEKVLGGKYLTEFMTLMILSWLARILLMMGKRVCLPLVHFLVINLSLLLCLKMLLQVGEYPLYWLKVVVEVLLL